MFPTELLNGLWHTTSLERLSGILKHGSITPKPNIPDSERWCTRNGEKNYPYVRHIGGVSLFDFQGFNPDKYSQKYPLSSWQVFVPKNQKFDDTIWIEIDRKKVRENLINSADLLKQWKTEEKLCHNIMPMIECAYIGELKISKFIQILLYDTSTNAYKNLHNCS